MLESNKFTCPSGCGAAGDCRRFDDIVRCAVETDPTFVNINEIPQEEALRLLSLRQRLLGDCAVFSSQVNTGEVE